MRYIIVIFTGIVAGFAITGYILTPVTTSVRQSIDLQKQIDSLQAELFIKQTEVGRYEMALELFKEEDSVGADHFEYILNTQTE